VIAIACARGESDRDFGTESPDGAIGAADDASGVPGRDAQSGDAALASDAKSPGDANTSDAKVIGDAAPDSPTAGMSADLGLPGAGGVPCTTPGDMASCPFLTVCRIASATGGRCEGCTTCGNLGNSCTTSSECDILFQCFQGKCTNICRLGTFYCGPIADCINVGNSTHGVCRP
jgi:hypothetical protein